MDFANLTKKNALLYASQCYDNVQCLDVQEFMEDYRRFRYVKRLCRHYLTTKHLRERLLLNHVVGLVNVFGAEATVRLLFVKCEPDTCYRVLKPILEYMSILPPVVRGINGYDIITDGIPRDAKVAKRLREL